MPLNSLPAGGAFGAATGNVLQDARLSPLVWIYLVCVILPVEFTVGSLALTPLRVFLLAVTLPLGIRLFAGQFGRVLVVDVFFALHMLWATLAVAVNNPDRAIENVGSAAVEFLGGYFVARACIRSPEQFEKLILVLVFIIILILPFSLPELFSGKPVIPSLVASLPGLDSVRDTTNPKRMNLERVQNVFAHPIHYGLFCSTAFTLLFLGMKGRVSFFLRALGSAVIFFSVFMSLSSGALLAVILQVGLLVWAFLFRKHKRKWLLLFGLFAVAYVIVDLLSNRTPMKVFMSYATFSAQTAYYRSIINEWGMTNVWANPVFGLGLRTWIRPSYMKQGSVDDFWLVMAMRYGIPGFLLLAIGYFWALVEVGRRNLSFSARAMQLRQAWMITFCGLSFSLVTVHVWTSVYSFVFFLFGTGMWLMYYQSGDAPAAADGPDTAPGPARRGHVYARPVTAKPAGRGDAAPVHARRGSGDAPRAFTRFAPKPAGSTAQKDGE